MDDSAKQILRDVVGVTDPWTPITDPEDQLIVLLECAVCPDDGAPAPLVEVGGEIEFLAESGWLDDMAVSKVKVIIWNKVGKDVSEVGEHVYECTKCRKRWSAFRSKYGDWNIGG